MRILTLGALALSLGFASMAQAQTSSLMARMERYCLATKGDAQAAGRLARADGWVTPPAAALTNMPADMRDLTALWTVYDGGIAVLMTGDMKDPRSALRGEVCAMAAMPLDASAVRDMETWVGSRFTRDGFAVYTEDGQGGRRILQRSDERAARAALQNGTLRGAGARNDKQMTVLMIMKLRQ